jgi:SNF2 family DNA or RNA helicase
MTEPKMLHPKLAKVRDGVGFYRHQVDGVNWCEQRQSFILADDMGLGKSLQALTAAAVDFERGVAHRILVVCLASLKYNWLDEIQLHTFFKAMVLDGKPDDRFKQMKQFALEGYDVLIVNYEQVVAHVGDLNELFFDIVIIDEAHSIKTPTSKRTKAVMGLEASRYMMLTGSPMLNRPDELWPLLHRAAPDKFPKYWTFRMRYCVFGGFQGKKVVGIRNKDELIEKMQPYMLRRLKKDVLTLPGALPPKQEWLTLTPLQKRMYKEAEEELKVTNVDGMTLLEINNVMTKFLRLKQIASTSHTLDPDTDKSTKLDRLEEIVEELCLGAGESLVVFTQFRGVLEAIENRLKGKIPTFVLHGDVKLEERQQRIRDWGRKPPAVLAAMLQVGGVGLNLVAASTVVFVDKLYVPALNKQAVDRLDRIGQTKEVHVIELLTRGTVERRIERLLKDKAVMFEDLIDVQAETEWKRKLVKAMLAGDDE